MSNPLFRAKFRVNSVEQQEESEFIDSSAVTDGSEENKSFAEYTPYGEFRLSVDNPNVIGRLDPGDEIYIDVTIAKKANS